MQREEARALAQASILLPQTQREVIEEEFGPDPLPGDDDQKKGYGNGFFKGEGILKTYH